MTAAYERHWAVNQAYIYGIYGFPLPAAVSHYDALDVADEDAWKVGAQVVLPTRTTVGGFFEDFHRYVPQELQFQNERQRLGVWLTVSQWLTKADSLHVGWAHAFKTPGDPGQHNTAINDIGNGGFAGGLDADNSANMITADQAQLRARRAGLFGLGLYHQRAICSLRLGRWRSRRDDRLP